MRGEDVAEVAAWHDDVGKAQPGRRQHVVRYLRDEPPGVDGVRRRERNAVRGGLGVYRGVGEDALDGGLRVVEVAAYADGVHVRVGGRRHLEALNARRAARGVEYDDLRAVDAREALHRRGASVAARRSKDEDAPPVRCVTHEDGQHREGDVLEGACPAVEEL